MHNHLSKISKGFLVLKDIKVGSVLMESLKKRTQRKAKDVLSHTNRTQATERAESP